MAYLDDNPPRTQQFRCPRRERPSGIIGVHTAESFPDEVGPDTGAENVARFIRDRGNYGSYHLLADSDSIIQLIEFRCVAYHIATYGLNEHTIGISAATQAAKWNSLGSSYANAMVRNMAVAAARGAKWLRSQYGIVVPARRISLAQARSKVPGFIAHGDADPARRTDPGSTFPWNDFLGYYADEMNGATTMSWNENLAPGTPGNDISGLADSILPDTWGRYAADLQGYAAAALATMIRTEFVKPYWPDETIRLVDMARWDHSRIKRGEDTWEKILQIVEAIADSQLGSDAAEIKAHIDQRHSEAAVQRQELADALDAAAAERADILTLVGEVGSGDLAAEEFVDAVARRLSGVDEQS